MGCSTSGSIIHPYQTQDTLYGVLRIQLVGGLIEGELNSPDSQVTAICKMSNQQFKSKKYTKTSFTNLNEVYEFMVNSRYQKYGRSLQIQLIESGLFSEDTVGVGLADLQLIIRERKRENFKIYLTREKSKVGWIQLQVLFQQFPTFPITLLFDSVLVRRKPTFLGDLQCRIRTTVGEQVLVSSFCIDKQDQPPSWKNQKFTFHILKGIIREGKIQVLHNDKEIGALSLNIEQIEQSSQSQLEISQQFYYGENIIAGTIKFFINKGNDINSVALQMKKSAFISPSKKKLPPLNANFKSNQIFTNQLTQIIPKNVTQDKNFIQNQLQNQLHHSQDSENQDLKIQHKFHENQANTKPIIIAEYKKNTNINELEKERKEKQLQQIRQLEKEAFQRKQRQQQQQNKLKLIKYQKQKQQRQEQFRTSELRRNIKQQEDQNIRQEQEKKIKQLEQIKLKEKENIKIKLQQQQYRIKLLEEERRVTKNEEQLRIQEQNRKDIQDEERKLREQSKILLQFEEQKKKIEHQSEEKRRIEQQIQQHQRMQQLALIQQKRKAEQLKKSKEQKQDRLEIVQLEVIRAKQELKLIEEQQTKQKYEKQQINYDLRQNGQGQLQEQQLQQSKNKEMQVLQVVEIKQKVQNNQQIIKQSQIREGEFFNQYSKISEKKLQIEITHIQKAPPIDNEPYSEIKTLKKPSKQQDILVSRQQSKNLYIATNIIEIKPISEDQQNHSIGIDKFKLAQFSGSKSEQISNLISAPNKNEQMILPNQRQHSRLLLESAFLENGSDDQSDK